MSIATQTITPLKLVNASVCYGAFVAVQHIHLSIEPGEVHVLLGKSGSGKTTLLRTIAGFERLDQGTIVMHGAIMDDSHTTFVPPEERKTGVVFQDYALFPHKTVTQNIAFGMRPPQKREIERLLELVALTPRAHAYPNELSGGEQQRVALARALAMKPKMLLFDEPFSNLDPELRQDLCQKTFDIVRHAKVSAILVTHSASEALSVADRISVLHSGNLLQTDTPHALYQSPCSVEVARSLGTVNVIPASTNGFDSIVQTPLGVMEDVRNLPTKASSGRLLVRPEDLILEHVEVRSETTMELKQINYQGSDTVLCLDAKCLPKVLLYATCRSFEQPSGRLFRARVRDALWLA